MQTQQLFAHHPLSGPKILYRPTTMDPAQRFYKHFLDTEAELSEAITNLPSISTVAGERQEATDHILAGVSKLQSEVADSAEFTPAYDRKQYSERVKGLQEKLSVVTKELAPKSRFQFKRKPGGHVDMGKVENDPRLNPASFSRQDRSETQNEDVITDLPAGKNYNEEMAQPSESSIRKPSFSAARNIGIDSQKGLHIILPSSAARATAAGSLTDLKDCIVDMSAPTGGAPFPSLAMRDIEGCVVVAGRVAGPCHITGVKNSIVVVSARQVRIHECEDVNLYLWCGSHPIIEDCKGLRFAPLPERYMTEAEDASGNQWDQVDDFKWLKASESPNWRTMAEEERLLKETWSDVVPGRPGASAQDTLAEIGLPRK